MIVGRLSVVEGGRIGGVGVKWVEMWRNRGGEGGGVEEE